jgi:uncharacterized integral membrane protein
MRNSDDMRGNGHIPGEKGKPNFKLWLAGAFSVYLLTFVLLNRDPVEVNFLFFKASDIGLIWVMLLVAVIAGALGWVAGRTGRRDKKKD